MDFVTAYDYLRESRGRVFEWLRPLTQEQYTRALGLGHGSLRATMLHIAGAEWAYERRLRGDGRPTPPPEDRPFSETRLPTVADLERAWADLAERTRAALAAVSDWNASLEYTARIPAGTMVFTVTRGDVALQLLFHEVHHRAQAMAMLRQLGVQAESIDYSVLKFRRRPA